MPLLAKIMVKCDPNSGVDLDILQQDLDIVVISEAGSARLPLRRTPDMGGWGVPGLFEIRIPHEDLTVIIQTDDEDDLGCAQIEKRQLEQSQELDQPISVLIASETGSWVMAVELLDIPQEVIVEGLDDRGNLEAAFDGLDLKDDPSVTLFRKGMSSLMSFASSQDIRRINEAIRAFEDLVNIASEDDANLPDALHGLSTALAIRCQMAGDINDFKQAISYQKRAIDIAPADSPDLIKYFGTLGTLLKSLFQASGDLGHIDEAISTHRKQVELCLTTMEPRDLPQSLSSLGKALCVRHLKTGDLENLTTSINVTEQALDLDSSQMSIISDLANALQCRFELTGSRDDIERVVELNQKAVSLGDPNDFEFPVVLNNLSIALMRRFRHSGDIGDLQNAISTQRRSVALTNQNNSDLPARLLTLGNLLESRCKILRDVSDIYEAISLQEQGIECTSRTDPRLPLRLTNLGISYTTLYAFDKEKSTREAALKHSRRALDLLPETHPLRETVLTNLANTLALGDRDLKNLTETIETFAEVNRLTPANHSRKPLRLGNLSNAYRIRFEKSHDRLDLREAIALLRTSITLTPEGHSGIAEQLSSLAELHKTSHGHTQDPDNLLEAISCFKQATQSPTGPPSIRFSAAKEWASLTCISDPLGSLEGFEACVDLIPVVAGIGKTVDARRRELVNISATTLHAASVALSLDQPEKALQWLEQARCLIWGQLLALQSPLDDLKAYDEKLATRFLQLSDTLEKIGFRDDLHNNLQKSMRLSDSERMSLQDEATRHVLVAQEWEQLLQTIRNVPKFQAFLRPRPLVNIFEDLPKEGPVVLVNVFANRCDALALVAGVEEPIHILLPNISQKKIEEMASMLRDQLVARSLLTRSGEDESGGAGGVRALRPTEVGSISVVERILSELWVRLVKPIMDGLGFSPSSEPCRMWWCTTGSLSFLPIHAAGIYTGPRAVQGETTISDFVIPSYTPSIAALTDRVRSSRKHKTRGSGLLLVSQPDAPGLPRIPGVVTEMRAIEAQLANSGIKVSTLAGPAATVQNGLERMKGHSSIHLACHGIQDPEDPLRSGFFMHDERLQISAISQSKIQSADFAFLSACQTSTGDPNLPEEALHLAAGMLAAGYRSVVGTMWSIQDRYAPFVAEDFYRYFTLSRSEAGDGDLDPSKSASALHHSIRDLRGRLGNSESAFLAWVPYVHFGL